MLMTSSNYGRYKIGRTRGNPLKRYKTLRTGDPGLFLEVAYFIPSTHGKLSHVEAYIHAHLADVRWLFHDESESEWFRGDGQEHQIWIENWIQMATDSDIHYYSYVHPEHVCRMYEADIERHYAPPAPLNAIDGFPF